MLRRCPARALPRREQRLRRRVAHDAFVDVDTVRYSVPYRLVRDHVDVAIDEQIVRIFHGPTRRRDARAVARALCPRDRSDALRRPVAARRPAGRATTASLTALGRDLADYAAVVAGWAVSVLVHARVVEQLTRLRLRYVAERLDAVLADAARSEPTYLDFLDSVLRQEVDAKQRTRVTMALKIAHFPAVKTLDDFEFKFQPSVDQRLVRELATARFLSQAENILLFGAPGVGKTHLAIGLGRAVVEAGHYGALHERHRAARGLSQSRDRRPARRAPDVLQQAETADHRRARVSPL
jgi:hypothetical protein